MTSLDQIDYTLIEDGQSTSQADQVVVSFHRRFRIAVNYVINHSIFDFYECYSLFELKWKKLASWTATSHFTKIKCVLPIEAYDVFAFIGSNREGCFMCLVGFDGKVRTEYKISQIQRVMCAEFNQKSREFLLGFDNGSMICLFLKLDNNEFNITLRKAIKVYSDDGHSPMQIASLDLVGLILILTQKGYILCIDATKFDLVFSIANTAFTLLPTRLWVDKFGTDFVVRSTNQNGNEQLECWHPPEDYASCRYGEFHRFAIPLSAQILSVSLETLSIPGSRTLLEIITMNKKMQVWSNFENKSLVFEAEMSLNVTNDIWQTTLNLKSTKSYLKDMFFGSHLEHYLNINSFANCSTEHLYCSTLLLTTFCNASTIIGIHLPVIQDEQLQQKFLELEIRKFQEQKSSLLEDVPYGNDGKHMIPPTSHQNGSNNIYIDHTKSNSRPDDDLSIMSETLIGALNNLAEIDKGIDEKLMQSKNFPGDDDDNHSQFSQMSNSVPSHPFHSSNHTLEGYQVPHNSLTNYNDSFSNSHLLSQHDENSTLPLMVPEHSFMDEDMPFPTHASSTVDGVMNMNSMNNSPVAVKSLEDLIGNQALKRSVTTPGTGQSRSYLAELNKNIVLNEQTMIIPTNADFPHLHDIESIFFMPIFYLKNVDTSRCITNPSNQITMKFLLQYFQILHPDGLLLTPIPATPTQPILQCFTVDGMQDYTVSTSTPEKIMNIQFHSMAYRTGYMTVVSNFKDCLIVPISFLPSPVAPLRVLLSIRHQVRVTSVVCADVILRNPDYFVAEPMIKPSTNNKSNKSTNSNAKFHDIGDRFLLILIGDDDGYIHMYICDENKVAITSDSFRAHMTGVSHIITTGDSVRPLWLMGSEKVHASTVVEMKPVAIPGSAIISISKEGEVKTWQPFSMDKTKNPIERLFNACGIKWRLSGVYIVEQRKSLLRDKGSGSDPTSKPITASPSKNPSRQGTKHEGRQRSIQSAELLPTCMHILLGYSNGDLEMWSIPGLIETPDMTLNTAQSPVWTSITHNDGINSTRVYVHGYLSGIKEVIFKSDQDRDNILAKLSSYLRVPPRMKYTIGYSFQEMKLMCTVASMVTCSNDCSIGLWGYQSVFSSYCHFLHPVLYRKFYLSNIPTRGLAFCTQLQCGNINPTSSHLPCLQLQWKVEAIVNKKIISIVQDTRKILFSHQENNTKDHQLLFDNRSYKTNSDMLIFEDDLPTLPANGTPRTPMLSSRNSRNGKRTTKRIVTAMPVSSAVVRPSNLVNAYQCYYSMLEEAMNKALNVKTTLFKTNEKEHAKDNGSYDLMGLNLLNNWSKVEEKQVAPVLSVVQYGKEMAESNEVQKQIVLSRNNTSHIDPNTIPEIPENKFNFAEHYVESNPSNHFIPSSPTKDGVKVLDFSEALSVFDSKPSTTMSKVPSSRASQLSSSGKLKFSRSGIFMEVDEDKYDPTLLKDPEEGPKRFVIQKTKSETFKPHISAPRAEEMNIDNEIIDQFSESTFAKNHQHHDSHPSTAGNLFPILDDDQCEISHHSLETNSTTTRTKISVSTVSYLKDSKVVKTIQVDGGFDSSTSRIDREKSFLSDPIINTAEPQPVVPPTDDLGMPEEEHLKYLQEQLLKKDDMNDSISVYSGSSAVKETNNRVIMQNRAAELRRKAQLEAKQRLELRQQHDGTNAEAGKSKTLYVSQTSMNKQDNGFIKGGVKQQVARATMVGATKAVVLKDKKATGHLSPNTKERLASPPRSTKKDEEGKISTSPKKLKIHPVEGTAYFSDEELEGGEELGEESPLRPTTPGGTAVVESQFVEEFEEDDEPNEHEKTPPPRKFVVRKEREVKSRVIITKQGKIKKGENIALRAARTHQFDDEMVDSIAGKKVDTHGNPIAAIDEDNSVHSTGEMSALSQDHIDIRPVRKNKIQLDLPDKRLEARKRHIVNLSRHMTEREVKIEDFEFQEKVRKVLHINEKGEYEDAEDDANSQVSADTIVSNYFDRNAKPIFINKSKAIKKTKSKTDEEDEGEVKAEVSQKPKEDPNAMLETYMNNLSEEERDMFNMLDEEARQKLWNQMKKSKNKSGINKKAKKKEDEIFKKLAKKAMEEAKLRALLEMGISLEPLEVDDEFMTISITVTCAGPVLLVLAKASEDVATAESFYQMDNFATTVPGFVEKRSCVVTVESFEEIKFSNLHPETDYFIYAMVDTTNASYFPITDEEDYMHNTQPPSILPVRTMEERLEIEWSRMDTSMRLIEIQAAIRCELVQMKAHFHYPIILIPTTAELNTAEVKLLISPHTMDQDSINNLRSKLKKHITIFLDWWIGSEKHTSKIRSEFHHLEGLYATKNAVVMNAYIEDGYGIDTVEMAAMNQYVKQLMTNPNATPVMPHASGGIVTTDEQLAASSYDDEQARLNQQGLTAFKKFRSWFKGGFIVRQRERDELAKQAAAAAAAAATAKVPATPSPQKGKHGSPAKAKQQVSSNASVNSVSSNNSDGSQTSVVSAKTLAQSFKRLVGQAEFLESFLKPLDDCIDELKSLYEGYMHSVAKKLKYSDLTYERAKLDDYDAVAIMASRKLEELCMQQSFVTVTTKDNKPFPAMDLSTMDPFAHAASKNKNEVLLSLKLGKNQQNIKTFSLPIVLQKLSGADLFKPINADSLKPDEPPPLNIKCLPGTKRRPLRPWQSMKPKDQILELSLACTLDSIWELAMQDSVVVPQPEDCLLSVDQFPLRAAQWDEFRKWYAGEEETNKVPGDGVPTLARVTFTEQYEMKQVEQDTYVVQLMKDMKFPLPLRYLPQPSITSADQTDDPEVASQFVVYNKSKIAMFASILQAYEKAVNTSAGTYIRQHLISKGLNKLLLARQMNFVKYFWAPNVGLGRVGLQYLFPHIGGMIYPRFSLPLKRYHLFPSRSKETYNSEEMLAWYTEKELDWDDFVMRRAEARGKKLRAYHEWLAKEPERLVYSRYMMALEDSIAHQHREIDALLTNRFEFQEQRMAKLDEDLDDGEFDPKSRITTVNVMSITGSNLMIDYEQFLETTAALAAASLALASDEGITDELVEPVTEEKKDEISEQPQPQPPSPSGSITDIQIPAVEAPLPLVPSASKPTTPGENKSRKGSPRRRRTPRESGSRPGSSRPQSSRVSEDGENALTTSNFLNNFEKEGFMAMQDTQDGSPVLSNFSSPRSKFALSRKSTGLLKTMSTDDQDDELNATLTEKKFRVLDSLPQEYWYIFEESAEFKYGSGIDNDDEIEEMQLLQQERMRQAYADAMEFEKSISDEKKRREMEEFMRLKKEEQERIYREGMARRRAIRDNFEDMKRNRLMKAHEEAAGKAYVAEEARLAEERRKKQEDYDNYIQSIEDQRLQELHDMEFEDIFIHDLKIRKREIRQMEHEDIMSYLCEQIQLKLELEREQKLKDLEEIYEPFVAYAFRESRVRLPYLQTVLQDHQHPPVKPDHEFANDEFDDDYFTIESNTPFSKSGRSTTFSLPDDDEIEAEIRKSLPTTHLMLPTAMMTDNGSRSSSPTHSLKRAMAQKQYLTSRVLQERETGSFASSKSSRNKELNDTELQDNLRIQRAAKFDDAMKVARSPKHASPSVSYDFQDPDLRSLGMLSAPSQSMDQLTDILASRASYSASSSSRISSPPKAEVIAVRSRFHSPTKKTIRELKDITSNIPTKEELAAAAASPKRLVIDAALNRSASPINSSKLPFNPYSHDWELFQAPPLLMSANNTMFLRTSSRGMDYRTGEKAEPPRPLSRNSNNTQSRNASRSTSPTNGTTRRPAGMDAQKFSSLDSEYIDPRDITNAYLQSLTIPPKALTGMEYTMEPIMMDTEKPKSHFLDHPLLNSSEILHPFSDSSGSVFHPSTEGLMPLSTVSSQFASFLPEASSTTLKPPAPDFTSHHSKKRKKLKELLSLSSTLLQNKEHSPPTEWIDYLTTQKKLTLSSLTALDPTHRLPQKFVNLDTVPKATGTGMAKDGKPLASKTLKLEKSPLDFKTFKLAKSASDTVIRLQQERETLRQYVSGRAIYEDGFYLQACEPGVKPSTILEASPEAMKFAEQIHKKINDEDSNTMFGNRRAPAPTMAPATIAPIKTTGIAMGGRLDTPAQRVPSPSPLSPSNFSMSSSKYAPFVHKSASQDSLLSNTKFSLKAIPTEPPPVLKSVMTANTVIMIPKVPIKKSQGKGPKKLKPLIPTTLNPFDSISDTDTTPALGSSRPPLMVLEDSLAASSSLISNELSQDSINDDAI